MGAVIAAVSKYRVDNVPLLLQPLFMLFGYGVGLAQFAYSCLIHWTCRIRYEGREALPADRNCIYTSGTATCSPTSACSCATGSTRG